MHRNNVVFCILILTIIIVAGVFFIIQNKKVTLGAPREISLTQPLTPDGKIPVRAVAPSPVSQVMYTTEGKLDTSNWEEYRSEYGGFSVMAPRGIAGVGCFGKGCEPARDGEPFRYILTPDDGGGVDGMRIDIIKKKDGTNLDNWISKYIISGEEYFSGIQKTSLGKYPALQFDIHVKKKDTTVYMEYVVYPSGSKNGWNIGGYSSISYRFIIVDLEDRYAIISYTLSIDSKAFLESLYDVGPLTPKFFDNTTLADIYSAILNSFQVFPPTKS